MTSLEELKEILLVHKVQIPDGDLEVLRDLIDLQADSILDQWLADKESKSKGVK